MEFKYVLILLVASIASVNAINEVRLVSRGANIGAGAGAGAGAGGKLTAGGHSVDLGSDTEMSVEDMQAVFQRSEDAHKASVDAMASIMSVDQAVSELELRNLTSSKPELSNILVSIRGVKGNLRAAQPGGYGGIDSARKLLNDMIYESMMKYDAEIAKCTEYYAKQCALMEVCRGEIAASNYVAANSRGLILDSQATINRCEVDIPETKQQLKDHNSKCKNELAKLNARLRIVEGDIAVMTMILKMTDCATALVQVDTDKLEILKCRDNCTKKDFISFNHAELAKKVDELKSDEAKKLFYGSFDDIVKGIEGIESIEFVEIDNKTNTTNKTNKYPTTAFKNPPIPMTELPGNPCTDPDKGAPSVADKRAAKCTIKKSPQCYKLQERFLHIQGGILDERDTLLEEIESMTLFCEDTKKSLETSISNDEDMLEQAQTKLAQATEKEANAGENARQVNSQNSQLHHDLLKQMKSCSNNYINSETELCALKKIRGELFKISGGGHSAFFQDCELTKWGAEECTKKCGGGTQTLTRSILTHPDGGTECLPLEAMKSCNSGPCPVDCVLAAWSGWSKCSADCGGGVQQRVRDVKVPMKFNGHPCGSTSHTIACNTAACETDCELSDWSKWSDCSKDCDGGTSKRSKFVKTPAVGSGKCPDLWSKDRLEYKSCNQVACITEEWDKPLACNKTLDIILLLDGRAGLGEEGWKHQITAAKHIVGAFEESGKAEIAIFSYSGPRTWSGVEQCTGSKPSKVDSEKVCGVKTVSHFTPDLSALSKQLDSLPFPKGGFLATLGLLKAKAELTLSRKEAPAVVIVFSAGSPFSFKKSMEASKILRKSARLLWVPITKLAPLKSYKSWATRRWQENIVVVKTPEELPNPGYATRIIADICPMGHEHINPEFAMGLELE